MDVHLVAGRDASGLLDDAAFRAEWNALCDACPWATGFQTPGFGAAWYGCHAPAFDPLLVLSRGTEGRLSGLLPLARSHDGRRLVVAGARQAEYVGWAATVEASHAFILGAIEAVADLIPAGGLSFHALPAGTPTAWIAESRARRPCLTATLRRPLLRFGEPNDGHNRQPSLDGRTDRRKLKQLANVGRIEFTRIADADEYARHLDRIAELYDCRCLALRGCAPYQAGDIKRAFSLALMRVPGLNHATVLTVDGRLASAQVHTCSRHEVHTGLLAHDPSLARFSPGRLHLLMLCAMLTGEGIRQFDFTPGGEAYKEQFANAADELTAVTVYRTGFDRGAGRLHRTGRRIALVGLRAARLQPTTARLALAHARQAGARGVARSAVAAAVRWAGSRRDSIIFRCEPIGPAQPPDSPAIRRDALGDLLAYRPWPGEPSRQEFMSLALRRLEQGHHVYTHAAAGRLLHYAWVLDHPPAVPTDGPPAARPASDVCAVLLDVKTAPDARRRGLASASIATIARDRRAAGIHAIVATVPADNAPTIRLLERLGFRPELSLLEQNRLGRRHCVTHSITPDVCGSV